jgi:hypothetical protein
VVARKKPVRKKKGMAVKLPDGSKATTDIQAKSFRQEFEIWERKAEGLTGDAIGMISPETSGMSLLDLVKNQGIAGRIKGKTGTKVKGKGGVQIFKALKSIFNSPSMSPEQETALKALDSVMNGIQGTKADPRNIMFSNPSNWDDDNGTVISTKPIYGHYRTDQYEIVRELKDEDVPAKDAEWYSTSTGTAKPPMWQVLYGEGNASPFNSPSLHTIVKNAIKRLDEAKLTIGKDNPVPIEGAKAATTALTISVIRQVIDSALDKGKGTTGSFPDSTIYRMFKNQAFDIRTEKESDAVKTLKNLNVPNDIEECWFKLSRRQIKRMAIIRAKSKGMAMHFKQTSGDVARSPLKFGERPEPDEEKKSFDNWQDMLVRL